MIQEERLTVLLKLLNNFIKNDVPSGSFREIGTLWVLEVPWWLPEDKLTTNYQIYHQIGALSANKSKLCGDVSLECVSFGFLKARYDILIAKCVQ